MYIIQEKSKKTIGCGEQVARMDNFVLCALVT